MQQFSKLINKHTDTLISLGLTGLFLYLLKPLYGVDFWYDEVMSLEEYILVPLKKTVTDYSAPNNHVFFSVLMNVWCRLWGISTFAQAAENVVIIRLLPAIITALTIIAVHATAKRLSNGYGGMLAAFSLVCILPFYNYGVQLRGYGLSMALTALLGYFCLRYFQKKWAWDGILVSVFTSLLLYTVPSNLYPVLGFLGVLWWCFVHRLIKLGAVKAINSIYTKLFLFVIAGVVLAIAMYLPVIKQVVNNDYVKTEGFFRAAIGGEAIGIFKSFFRPYYILPILLITGLIVGLIKKVKLQVWWILMAVIIIPFVISYVRGDRPFDRTFMYIAPLLAVWVGVSYFLIYENWVKNTLLEKKLGIVLLILMSLGFNNGSKEIKDKLTNDVKNEKREYSIYYNNLLSPYHTYQNLRLLKENNTNGLPVFLHEVDKYAMHGYLPALDISWEPNLEKIKQVNSYYIITAYPTAAIKKYLGVDSSFTFKRLNPEMDFVNILEARRK